MTAAGAIPELTEDDVIPIPGGRYVLRSEYEAWLERSDGDDQHLSAVAEFDALTAAAALWPPPCAGDPRYVADALGLDERRGMHETCTTRCRIRDQCAAYADKARPPAGIWAGMFYTPTDKRERP